MRRLPSPLKRAALVGLALLLLGGLATAGYLAAQEELAIYLVGPDGASSPKEAILVTGRFETVAEALQAAGISPGPQDLVTPPLEAAPLPEEAIVVQQARQVRLVTDEGERLLWSRQPNLAAFLVEAGVTVGRTDRLLADGRPVAFNALERTPLPARLEISRFLTVTVLDGEKQLVVRTQGQTVGQALQDAGITIYAADGVEPALGQWLAPATTIRIRRSMPLTIQADGRVIQTRSHSTNSLEVLAAAGIGLAGADYAIPGPETPLRPDQTIRVVRVTEDFRVEDEPIPFDTLWQPTDRFELDSSGLLQAGAPGIRRRRIRVRYENGLEVSQSNDGEWVALEPVPQVMGYGTQVVLRQLQTEEGVLEYWRKVRMRVTSYTAASSGKEIDHPAYGITASGRPAGKGVVAIDRSIVPWRSYVYVPGYGVGFAGDTGGGVKGRWIDLGYGEADFESWTGYVDVYFLTPVPPPEAINYLLPSTLP